MDLGASTHPILRGTLEALERCLRIIEIVPDSDFPKKGRMYNSIGSHIRHCIDYYHCFLKGIEGGIIDYDTRERNTAMSNSRDMCEESLEKIKKAVRKISERDLNRKIFVQERVAPGAETCPMTSSIARELNYLSYHTIHHISIMIEISVNLGCTIPGKLGTNYSTDTYKRSKEKTN